MSFDKLKGKMTEGHLSQKSMAQNLGITVQALNAKLNGRSQFTLGEVVKITEMLSLKDPVDIFLIQASQNCNKTSRTGRRRVEMNDSKEEIENLRKQINRLKICLMFTQISTIMVTIILGCQCLWSIQNYHYLLQQVSMCLESVNTVYSALRQFFSIL